LKKIKPVINRQFMISSRIYRRKWRRMWILMGTLPVRAINNVNRKMSISM
jgi:hypothetical protein